MSAKTVEELKVEYADTDWRRRFVAFTDLMDLLGDCIIGDEYVVPDRLNEAIKLSEAGHAILDKLTRKEKVNAKDGRLMCALSLGHTELFVDLHSTDVDEVAAAIHDELVEGAIKFPFVLGRDLYDTFASQHEGEKDLLTVDETQALLAAIPPGVFQYGQYTVGPFGLRKSRTARKITASRRVAAYHCAVSSCHSLHPVVLQTSETAPINRDRRKLQSVLQYSETEACDWWDLANEFSGLTVSYYGDKRAGVLLPLIGDALNDAELSDLVTELLDFSKGALRKALAGVIENGSAAEMLSGLSRAQLLQITLLADEDAVAAALDRLVHRGVIKVSLGDVRRTVISDSRSGAFALRAELGHYGVRFVSDDLGLALLRQRRLLNQLYVRETGADVQELEWQLRGIDIDDLDERLEHFFQTRSPKEALERLVLARKTNMITACFEVGIENGDDLTDSELVDALLWKLGFPPQPDDDPHANFWHRHERLWALTQSSAFGSSERFIEAAAPYFAELEGILLNSLAYTAWALMADHVRSSYPFSYDDEDDRLDGLALLQTAYGDGGVESSFRPDFPSEKVELKNLIEGFSSLAYRLEECRDNRGLYERKQSEMPLFDGKTELKRFALRSTLPFLDLSRPSQDRILEGLRSITASMLKADVFAVRNDYAHYRRTAPDISRVETALEATRSSVTRIENLGFARLQYVPSTVRGDEWGQTRHEFRGPRSYEHTFTRPTTLDWMGLPSLKLPQYLMTSASFGDPNEVLRFTRRYAGEFSRLWAGYPNRRKRGSGTSAADGPSFQPQAASAQLQSE
ncbi:hypothetical protein [Microbacterium sp. TNHR37B]|uniref:hypothetical protein n=1 Tax=Microbacterium sp. TNHR37B TaxID=1775956 RepID=UPI0007B26670|nr:hypothetical protein [Microbacterium sp. TNHR37B]KZE89554.1 hypothetical protein AVP41_02352 [Microbacterium sp. TNHR37B]